MIHESRQKVVVGIIYNQFLDSVLVAKRPEHKTMGGLWEFPGGKSRTGESELETLIREISEETGVIVNKARQIQVIDHDYPNVSIKMSVWLIDSWSGHILGKEGQLIKWSKIDKLSSREFPEANAKLIKLLRLPLLYLITPDLKSYGGNFFNTLSGYLENGLKLIQFRCPSLTNENKLVVAEKLLKACESYDCKVIINGSYEEAKRIGAHGVHLNSIRLMDSRYLRALGDFYVAGSCHNNEELNQAQKCNLDYCVLSPVNNTKSHGDSRPLRWKDISILTNSVQIPVYALGGVKHHDVNRALESGCYGISMISGVWESKNGNSIINSIGNRHSILSGKI